MKVATTSPISTVLALVLAYGQSAHGELEESKNRKLNGYAYQDPYYNQGYYDPYGYPYKATAYPTPYPTPRPTPKPTNRPTPDPTARPSAKPSPPPTPNPTPVPTTRPTPNPTLPAATERPTPSPTRCPTPYPTPYPTDHPTRKPTPFPTPVPTRPPTPRPTARPTPRPTPMPTPRPTGLPSSSPTLSAEPSENPTQSAEPSENPTDSAEPSENPTESAEPSEMPTDEPRTIAEIICAVENLYLYGDFCAILRITGLDFVLNDFRPLDLDGPIDVIQFIRNNRFIRVSLPRAVAEAIGDLTDYNDRALQNLPSVPSVDLPNINVPPNLRLPNVPVDFDTIDFGALNDFFRRNFNEYFVRNPFLNFNNANSFRQFMRLFLNDNDVEELWTVFAPTNQALRSMNFDLYTFLTQTEYWETNFLTFVATYHIIAGRVIPYGGLTCGNYYQMSNGWNSRTVCPRRNEKYQVGTGNREYQYSCIYNNALLCTANWPLIIRPRNVIASNGLIHTVDNTLIPFGYGDAPSASPSVSSAPSISTQPSASPSV